MTSGDDNGGGKQPPSDDRTLLDPLSNEELRALREARKRMQEKKAAGKSKAIKNQIVITPETPEAKPDPSPRDKPALPSFEGDVTLDQIRVPPNRGDPASRGPTGRASADAPSDPATAPTDAPGARTDAPVPDAATAPGASKDPRAGTTGFGENTLLWMQPVKAPPASDSTSPSPQDPMFQSTPTARKQRSLQIIGAVVVVAAVVGVLAFLLAGSERGVLELSTQPPGARLFVNGELRPEKTPVKLTLPAGMYTLRVEKDGYEAGELNVEVDGELDAAETIDLRPKSNPGLQTITVDVEPIAATVTVDGQTHRSVRTVHVPNLDPNQEHRIRVEAGGFIKTEQVIRAGELQERYQFVLERDESE
jgi:hypothetical protein